MAFTGNLRERAMRAFADRNAMIELEQRVGSLNMNAGAVAAALAGLVGTETDGVVTEGTEVRVIDEVVTLTNAVTTNLTNTVPAGAVIVSVQANLNTAVTGDASGDDLFVKVGIGTSGDPDKYGLSADLTKNAKVNTIPDWAVLASAETIGARAAKTDGTAATEKFTAGGKVRIRVVYLTLNSLVDAA